MTDTNDAEGSGRDRRFRELKALYAALDAAVSAQAPICRISGLCCRFREYGHTLFLSGPEAELLLAEAPAFARPIDDGETCPWQDDRGRCTAREARPVGCRTYFCDPAFQGLAPEISEAFLSRLKRWVEVNNLDWNYAPLHQHLRAGSRDA